MRRGGEVDECEGGVVEQGWMARVNMSMGSVGWAVGVSVAMCGHTKVGQN